MEDVGVRELKAHASSIIHDVWRRNKRFVVTYRGRPVGMISPLPEGGKATDEEDTDAGWESLMSLMEDMATHCRTKKSAAEIISEIRR